MARSSPRIFDNFATALEYIMNNHNINDVIHYLDDYFTVGPPNITICDTNSDAMMDICKNAGFSIQQRKVVRPCEIIEFRKNDKSHYREVFIGYYQRIG